jgi:hypothetical protein
MPRYIAKLFNAPLILTAAALVLHIGTATAADSTSDIQAQMRELLTGTQTTHFVPQSGPHAAQATPPAVDSQQFARQLLLGTSAYRVGGSATSQHPEVSGAPVRTEAHHRPLASLDMQAAVRQLLLGQPHAADAS